VCVERCLSDGRFGDHPVDAHCVDALVIEEAPRNVEQALLGVQHVRGHTPQRTGYSEVTRQTSLSSYEMEEET
jgi:hypothetical protein